MRTAVARREDFIARQAVFLQRQGADSASAQARLATVFSPEDLSALGSRVEARPGSFRHAFARAATGLDLAPEALGMAGLAFEQAVAEAYLGLWRGLLGFAHYTLGLAIVTTIAFQVLLIFVVPQFVTVLSANTPQFSRLLFETGLGVALQLLLWLLVAWIYLSVFTARRAILLRVWPARFAPIGLLRNALARHRDLLYAWGAMTLLDAGAAASIALDRSRDAVVAWTRSTARLVDMEAGRELLENANTIGTLREELHHRVASELTDAPLALAALRERFALGVAVATAFLVVPILIAMYLMVFRIAASV